jgi:hypothetical protein
MAIIPTLRSSLHGSLLIATLLAAALTVPLPAEDSVAIAAFAEAFSGSDEAAKRAALPAIIAMGKDADDTVYRLLVQAVGDPQTHDVAVPALRARSGLAPNFFDHGPGYPGYPQSDTASDWNAWLASRGQDQERTRTLNDQSRRIAALAAPSTPSVGGAAAASAASPAAAASERAHASATPMPPSDLGSLSRIVFADGSTLVGHVVDRHRDANGVVLTVEFIHQDGGGREVIPIERIARIEADAP